jgi:antitoxin (DNA-binding transcriptional repressor) of toxin-antitoxin stability system
MEKVASRFALLVDRRSIILADVVWRLYNVAMKTLSITQGRQNLGAWLKRALRGEDVGFLVDGRVVALRPVAVHSEDYVLHEYGVSEKQIERAHKAVKADVKAARASGHTRPFTGEL